MNKVPLSSLTAEGLAGYCLEVTAWQLLRDLSEVLLAKPQSYRGLGCIAPERILVEDGRFVFDAKAVQEVPGIFDAPEQTKDHESEAAVVWSLGATVFYLIMGCAVMNGRGGRGQRDTSKLPYMRSEMPELSELVQRSLSFSPAQRPTLAEVNSQARKHYDECLRAIKAGPKLRNNTENDVASSSSADSSEALWPEAMIAPTY